MYDADTELIHHVARERQHHGARIRYGSDGGPPDVALLDMTRPGQLVVYRIRQLDVSDDFPHFTHPSMPFDVDSAVKR